MRYLEVSTGAFLQIRDVVQGRFANAREVVGGTAGKVAHHPPFGKVSVQAPVVIVTAPEDDFADDAEAPRIKRPLDRVSSVENQSPATPLVARLGDSRPKEGNEPGRRREQGAGADASRIAAAFHGDSPLTRLTKYQDEERLREIRAGEVPRTEPHGPKTR